jgi:malic enzyme
MHSIIHNWPDEKCKQILMNLTKALKPGYSKILIHDIVIPEVNADWQDTAMDLIMMMVHAAQEGTVPQWHKLVESAGLKITGIFTVDRGTEGLIECELP